MRRLLFVLPATLALVAALAAPAAAAEGDPQQIMIMKHACGENIGSIEDFEAVEAQGDSPVGQLVQTVLACPTIINPGDEGSGGIAADPAEFAFTITDANGETYEWSDATFQSAQLCESDVNMDADGDGTISEDTCLDISHYVFDNVPAGELTVTETTPPSGHEYGTLRFTPSELSENNDAESLTGSRDQQPIQLDTSNDTDNMVMLHVYNFQTAASASPSPTTSPTTSPAATPTGSVAGATATAATLPPTDVDDRATGPSGSPLLPVLLVLLVGASALGGVAALRQRR